jgi:dephospho-CoA kinase
MTGDPLTGPRAPHAEARSRRSVTGYDDPVLLFGLTGGIASGKSTVAARFRARGVPVIDADALAREVVQKGTPALAEIVEAFGEGVLGPSGDLDRKALAAVVFDDEAKRRRLNQIVHPRVTELTLGRAASLRELGEPLACYEAALIVENGAADAFRPLVVVAASEAAQIERARARDGATDAEARARIRAQTPLADKIAAADYVIENDGSRQDVDVRSDEVLGQICAAAGIDLSRYPVPTPTPRDG